jgi:hypothetical protein
MSNNYELIEVENFAGEIVQHIVIPNGNGFTSMLKSTYDAQQEALANGNNL